MKGKLIGMIKLNHILILNCTPLKTNNFTIRDLQPIEVVLKMLAEERFGTIPTFKRRHNKGLKYLEPVSSFIKSHIHIRM
jgi:hypothetical protein